MTLQQIEQELNMRNANAVAQKPSIVVENLRRAYGGIEAVRGVSFSIPEGCIWGLLGPNGAGKTSIIEMVEGLRRPDSGRISVLGLDPFHNACDVRALIGAQLQSIAIPDKLRVLEAVKLFSSFYRNPMPADELLEVVGLSHRRSAFFDRLSGGEKQRVAIGLALVGNPRVLFLDEPTTGLDAETRRNLHDLIAQFRAQGKTVLITTHYIEEAEKLCDQVGILDHGKLLVTGSPRELIKSLGHEERLEVRFRLAVSNDDLSRWAGPGVSIISREQNSYQLRGASGSGMLARLAVQADRQQNEILEARIIHVTLEDVYLDFTRDGNK